MPYKKHFIPLESNPDVFTGLMHDLGVSNRLKFVDVWSIDDPDQLAVVPHPVLALILVLPSSDTYEQKTSAEESNREAYSGNGDEEGVMWLKQTINNACGLYAPLHALCNMNRVFVGVDSLLNRITTSCLPLAPPERAEVIENSAELEHAYNKAALQGLSETPDSKDEVDCHFVRYVKSASGTLYELDGDLKGPVRREISFARDEDMLTDKGLGVIKDHVQRENRRNLQFSLLALCTTPIDD